MSSDSQYSLTRRDSEGLMVEEVEEALGLADFSEIPRPSLPTLALPVFPCHNNILLPPPKTNTRGGAVRAIRC